jgi:hypothetical protein
LSSLWSVSPEHDPVFGCDELLSLLSTAIGSLLEKLSALPHIQLAEEGLSVVEATVAAASDGSDEPGSVVIVVPFLSNLFTVSSSL